MLGAYGLSEVQTPNLDALAGQAILFDHCVSNAPVCTPYRSMLISGQHPLWNNCFENDRQLLTDVGPSFGEMLGEAGYRSGYIGKWHLYGGDRDRPVPPGPNRHGFDDGFWTNNCHLNYDPSNAFYWEGEHKTYFGDWEVAGQTEQALNFLKGQDDSRPFSLFVSYHAPHNHDGGDPETYLSFDAPEQFKERYQLGQITLRPSVPDNPRSRRMLLGYMAMCTEIDHHVGRILHQLQSQGLAENTIVVYTSDHGETFGAYSNHWHKGCPEDVSVRVPLIIRLPDGVNAGWRSQLLLGTLDLMPTLLGLMGLRSPGECHGTDLSLALRNRDDDGVESVPLFYFTTPWRGVYTRRWTYSYENVDRSPRALSAIASDIGRTVMLRRFDTLYDREEDPHQLYNLYGHAEKPGHRGHTQVSQELHDLTLTWLAEFEDPFPNQTELTVLTSGRDGRPVDHLRGRHRTG